MKNIVIIILLCVCNIANCQITNTKQNLCTAVQDQYMSGTCWSFASLSFLESEMIRLKIPVVNLSEMFVARHAYMYKIKEHLKQKGANYFTSGGQFQDVQKVINAYGIVPETAYSGKPKNTTQHNHGLLDTTIVHYVNKLLAKKITTLNTQQEQYINSIFDQYLGKLPTTFVYNNVQYTPKSFAAKIFKLNINDYINITSYNQYTFNSNIVLNDKYNWSKSTYYNVPFKVFKSITDSALQNGYTILWDGDVTEDYFDFDNGTAFSNFTQTEWKDVEQERNASYLTKESKIDHVMHIVGTANNEKNENLYYVKNSWGNNNAYNGFMYMNTPYFAIKTVAIVLHKKMLPPQN